MMINYMTFGTDDNPSSAFSGARRLRLSMGVNWRDEDDDTTDEHGQVFR